MSNKKQFEEIITNLPKEKLLEFLGLDDPYHMVSAFNGISINLKTLTEDCPDLCEIFEDVESEYDSEECRQTIIDNFWRIS
jgi:predicted Zn-dependent protease with MMP-like domain